MRTKDNRKPRPGLKEEVHALMEEYFRIARNQGKEALRKRIGIDIAERKNAVQETESEKN